MSKKTGKYEKADISDPAVLDMLRCHREGNLVVPNGKTMFVLKLTPQQIKVSEPREALRIHGKGGAFILSDQLTDCAKCEGYEPWFPPEATCRVCGTSKDVDKVETVVNLVNENAPDSHRYTSISHYCKPCLAERISGRMGREWAPGSNVSQARLDWVAEARPLMDATNDAKGGHLLKLLPAGQALNDPDLLGAVDGFPFTVFGTAQGGTNYFDLGALIRSWADPRGLSEDCPHCLGKGSLHVFAIGGSFLSGEARWSGFCRTCARVIHRQRESSEKGISFWIGYFSRAKNEIGRSLLSPRRGL